MFDRFGPRVGEQAAVLALVSAAGAKGSRWSWHEIAATISEAGSALKIIEGDLAGVNADAEALSRFGDEARELIPDFASTIQTELAEGHRCVTVLDDDYPDNLREIYNLPPFIFTEGKLLPADGRSIAVVGTRQATEKGIDQARRLASGLAREGVTVTSGMALGVDTAAHEAALEAGGRTVAVLGTGIHGRYPKANTKLADRIAENGALVSQFWPDSPATRYSFPLRNIVTSGLSLGTVVIEASSTSGAKSQARNALEHGKLVFLVESLVMSEEWAQSYVTRRGAIPISDVDDILDSLITLTRSTQAKQLRLA